MVPLVIELPSGKIFNVVCVSAGKDNMRSIHPRMMLVRCPLFFISETG
jgi:hypothetical protein